MNTQNVNIFEARYSTYLALGGEPKEFANIYEIDLAILKLIEEGGGGGADYKTNIYMDGDSRVMVERMEDGSTVFLDEHENPILKRLTDGTTQYFDAYQSVRMIMDEHGEISINDSTHGTLALAESILTRTKKQLLYNKAGETTIKDADGKTLTHADIYAMLMTSPDFVVLVRSDHAFHPNLVTPTQIAFTCSYLGTDGFLATERVNITNANAVSYSVAYGIVRTADDKVKMSSTATVSQEGAVAQGYKTVASGYDCHAEGEECKATNVNAHAEGYKTTASGHSSHAEGNSTKSTIEFAHAEGDSTSATSIGSHAEGRLSTTTSYYAHAEGFTCTAGGNSSHAEGHTSKTTGSCSHAEGRGTIASGYSSHSQGYYNIANSTDGCFIHGCGTSEDDRQNAFMIVGSLVYVKGIGGFDGTNYGTEGVLSLQEVLANMLNPEVAMMSLYDDEEDTPKLTYKDKPVEMWTATDIKQENEDRLEKMKQIGLNDVISPTIETPLPDRHNRE